MELIKESLHEHEKLVLKALKKGELEQEQLSKAAGIPNDSVARACLWLQAKELVEIKEQKTEYVQLNEEGLEYAEKGLPEQQALNAIAKGAKTVQDLKKALGDKKTGIALSWLMKRKLAEINRGTLELTQEGQKAIKTGLPEEKTLSLLEKKTNIEKIPELKIIEQRGKIIKKTHEIKRTTKLTTKGKELLKEGIKTEKTVNMLTSQMIKTGSWKKTKFRQYNIQAPSPPLKIGKKQPYLELLNKARRYLFSLGFKELRYPIIETEFYNFDALYQPQFHPARSTKDTYYIKKPEKGTLPKDYAQKVKETHENGWTTGSKGWQYKWNPEKAKQMLLRTHTTSSSIRAMHEHNEIPAKYFTISRNFRRDVIDATHLPEFFQCEGIIIQENMNFRELLGMLSEFAKVFAGTKKIRFNPDFFPYTEPSVELVAEHPTLGEIELGGAGMFRPEVRLPAGVDAEVMAWGLGFDRLSMIKLGLEDIRELFSHDLAWLEQTKTRND
ncbi:phenylalanine--tRNA ligase subunit alpha [archaeon]|nr:phenylalanine--tRNA ligase subunit alpha [archaeon]